MINQIKNSFIFILFHEIAYRTRFNVNHWLKIRKLKRVMKLMKSKVK